MKKYLPICIIVVLSVVCLSIYGKEEKKEEFKTNTIKENDNKFTIAAYINGVFSDTMPTESKYFGYVECRNSSGNKLNTLGFVEWENDKWNVRITDITKASTCNVYFIDPPDHWLDAESGTLLRAIKDNNKVENVKTIPGKQINKTNEAVLSGTYDDYGTSYYFRGNVKNNYVKFAGKCWRIVRITGDGSIKLWLWNNADSCTSKTVPTSAYNASNNHNAYIGFMYGNIESNEFSNATETGVHDNIYDSTILSNLKIWYDTAFQTNDENEPTKYTDLLADVIWCGDKKIVSGTGIGTTQSTYGFSARRTSPSYICHDAGYNGKISKYTAYDVVKGNGKLKTTIPETDPVEYKYYKIGLLTADEVLYAGGMNTSSNSSNSNYYLAVGQNWSTMTPARFDGNTAHVNFIFYVGNYIHDYHNVDNNAHYMRPSIALNYNVQATYDETSEYEPGTVNNPYIVQP